MNASTHRAKFRSLALHAERLERNDVWDATLALLESLEARAGRATLFVHPYSAIMNGADLAPRISELLKRGHEIGQHTHFYAWRPGEAPSSGKPPVDLSDENVVRCLDRDREYLLAAGAVPTGFTSGAWVIADAVVPWLARNGFRYDCSVRSFDLPYANDTTAAGGGRTTVRVQDGVVLLPTSAPLRRAVRGALLHKASEVSGPGFRYDLAYTHDYDLTRRRSRAAARLLVGAWTRGPWRTAGELAELARKAGART